MIDESVENTMNKTGEWQNELDANVAKQALKKSKERQRKSKKIIVRKKAKIVILGDERTGKTSLAKRYCLSGISDDSKICDYLFDWKEQITIRATHFQRKEYLGPKEDHELTLDMWDTPGQERYKTLNQAYIRGADGAIIVYNAADLDNENLKRIKDQV